MVFTRLIPEKKKIKPITNGTAAVNLPTATPSPPIRKAYAPQTMPMMPNIVNKAPNVLFIFIIFVF